MLIWHAFNNQLVIAPKLEYMSTYENLTKIFLSNLLIAYSNASHT